MKRFVLAFTAAVPLLAGGSAFAQQFSLHVHVGVPARPVTVYEPAYVPPPPPVPVHQPVMVPTYAPPPVVYTQTAQPCPMMQPQQVYAWQRMKWQRKHARWHLRHDDRHERFHERHEVPAAYAYGGMQREWDGE